MNSVTIDIDREVHAPVETTRRTVLAALSRLGFTVDKAQGTRIHAERGDQWLGGLRPQKRPVHVEATLLGDGSQTMLHLHLSDGAQVLLDPVSAQRAYRPVFQQIHDEMDTWLAALDPGVQTAPLPEAQLRLGDVPAMRRVGRVLRQVGVRRTGDRLSAEPTVIVTAPDATAVLSMNDAQMCFAIASMITSDATVLPAPLMHHLERVTLVISRALENAAPPTVRVDIDAEDVKVIELLHQQASIRQGLPVREVQRCRDCTQEKIVNPDYRARAKKNKWINDMLGVVGISMGTRPQVFALAGRLFNMKMLAPPDFVCARCQGTDVDVALATMCPQCHAIRREPLLLTCGTKGCGFDFRSRVTAASLWQSQPTPTATAPGRPSVPSRPVAVRSGWFPDPSGRHQMRYYDGAWTDYVADHGTVTEDPLAAS